jgi:hypothetical protein
MALAMTSPLERRVENIALRLAAAPGGVPGLAIAARLPLSPLRTLDLLAALARRGPLAVEERDGISFYQADGAPLAAGACPSCARPCPPERPLCGACLPGWGRFAAGEHAILGALAAADGAEVALATLAAAGPLTAKETEALLTALAGRGAVAISSDPARIAWRPPRFDAPASWRDALRGPPRDGLFRAALRHHRRVVLGAVLAYAAAAGYGYARYVSTRKSAANAYWHAFFTVKHHEELLARYVDRVPGLDANRARAELGSMAELDVAPRLRRDYLLHEMVKRVHADGHFEDGPEVLGALEDFERKWAEESARYDERARAHKAAVESPWGRAAGWLVRVETIYDPLPQDLWAPRAVTTK